MQAFMKRNKINYASAVTLAELLISIALIGFVLLAAASIDIAARRFFSGAEEGVAAINDMSVAMEYMVRDLESAIGDFSSPPFALTANGFQVRLDLDDNGLANDAYSVTFEYNSAQNQITRNTIVIANRITDFDITPSGSPVSEVTIMLEAKDDPAGSCPELSLQGKAYMRAAPAR
jgi:hypothetical protein